MISLYRTLFGNEIAELSLLYIQNYGSGHIRGIASTFDVIPRRVQLQLEKLEADGILVSQFVGKTKQFKLNPRLAIKTELSALLEKILELLPDAETKQYFRQRQRPRRTGKLL